MELLADESTHQNQLESAKPRDRNNRTQVTGKGELKTQTFGDECLAETNLG